MGVGRQTNRVAREPLVVGAGAIRPIFDSLNLSQPGFLSRGRDSGPSKPMRSTRVPAAIVVVSRGFQPLRANGSRTRSMAVDTRCRIGYSLTIGEHNA